MADGRYEEVTSLFKVNIGLGEQTVRIQLLILHNIIALVLGWDLTRPNENGSTDGMRRIERNDTGWLIGGKQATRETVSSSRGES